MNQCRKGRGEGTEVAVSGRFDLEVPVLVFFSLVSSVWR